MPPAPAWPRPRVRNTGAAWKNSPGSPDFQEMLHREFPKGASEWLDSVSRRGFLKLMGASLAMAGMSACTKQPLEPIVPYVRQPEEVVPGRPLFFATAFSLGGYASPILVESHLYRPTKIEGNEQHPASLGGTDIFLGRLDGSNKHALLGNDVLVCVVNTAARLLPELVKDAIRDVILVADECHRYGAETFSGALAGSFGATLGLSATPERSGDPGMETNVFPRLGPLVFEYGYAEALKDGVISEFDVTFVGLSFSRPHRDRYEALTKKISERLLEIELSYPQLEESPYLFLDLQRILDETHDQRLGELFRFVTQRQQLIQQAPARAAYVKWLAAQGLPGQKGILFHSRIDDCETLAQTLGDLGITAGVHVSGPYA